MQHVLYGVYAMKTVDAFQLETIRQVFSLNSENIHLYDDVHNIVELFSVLTKSITKFPYEE